MLRRLVLCSPFLFACAPKLPSETDGEPTSTSDGDGATSTSGPAPTSESTTSTSGPAPTTGITTEPASTTDASSGTTGAPEAELRIFPVELRPSQASGLDGLEWWKPDPSAEWCDPEPCRGVPTLGEPRWLVDGAFAEPEAIVIGSRVAVLVPYQHPGCALACGMQTTEVTDEIEGGGGIGNLPADLPCGTAASGVWLALDFGLIVRGGMHRAALRIEDRCAVGTEFWSATFEPG
ncbi:hypothetical protein [Nannocystis bainbridge]|uniref:Uncharacterized protein n=1 Tax=Nannocystis bainbridge TaxID=2995303 RepID=A0ABT5DNY5_9BACT|nr:hypothetical protein [Nannocystis bainbridge]MDC0715313.1 hypothetical protein [Nannocystis bainbridge]